MKKTIGEKIAILRKSNNLSQKQLADSLNVSNKTISKWECNNGEPDIETLKRISTLFNISVDDLLNDELNFNKSFENNDVNINKYISKNKFHISKKMKYIISVTTGIVIAFIIFITCFFSIPRVPNISSQEDFIIDNNEKTLNLSVSNDTENYSFINKINVPLTNNWSLYSDINCNNEINSQTVSLGIGDNVFYILVKNNRNDKQVYTVNIRRKPIYTIKFIAQNSDANLTQTFEIQEGEYIDENLLTQPNRSGYFFEKWDFDFENPIINDMNIYAIWIPFNIKIKYYSNFNDEFVEQNVVYDSRLNLLHNQTFSRLGYSLTSWNTKEDGTGISYSTSYYFNACKFTRNVDLYAQWKIINYFITYEYNDGDALSNINYYNVNTSSFVLNNPIKTGYNFIGWTSNDITNPQLELTVQKGTTGNLSFYANYSPIIYTIDYVLNNGVNNINPTTYTIESPTITLTPLTFENETISRWYIDDNFKDRIINIPTGSYGNKTIYARGGYDVYDLLNIETNVIIDFNNDFVLEFGLNDLEIDIPEDIIEIGCDAFNNCDYIANIIVPDSVQNINKNAFYDCSKLENILFSETSNLEMIGENAFYNCNMLNMTIPNNVRSIGKYAFYQCSSLEDINLSQNLTSIGNYAFDGCIGLTITRIIIPINVAIIGSYAFHSCNLTIYCEASSRPTGWEYNWDDFSHGTTHKDELVYWYSATTPHMSGNYWYYYNGSVRVWKFA